MGILSKLRRHAAVASGNFDLMFRDVEIPPLSDAAALLIAETNKPEPDMVKLGTLLSSTTDIAARMLKTVNSSLYGLRHPVTSVERAVTLIGLNQIRTMALAYAAMESIPSKGHELFDPHAFWNDSLLKAIFSRTLAERTGRGRPEEAFTASLLADIAVPVLQSAWGEYYGPVLEEWRQRNNRLSEIERIHFSWDHAQAGAWILHTWEFPEEIICFIGAHTISWEEIYTLHLENTAVAPIAVAALISSVLKPDPERAGLVYEAAIDHLSLQASSFLECINSSKQSFNEIRATFGLTDSGGDAVFDALETAADQGS